MSLIVKLLLVRKPPLDNLIYDALTAAAHLVNLTVTVYNRQAGAYLETREANGATPRSFAVSLKNFYQFLI